MTNNVSLCGIIVYVNVTWQSVGELFAPMIQDTHNETLWVGELFV
jgi:hypothetical protein